METGAGSPAERVAPSTGPSPGGRGFDADSRIGRLATELGQRPDALIELLHRLQGLEGYLDYPTLEQMN